MKITKLFIYISNLLFLINSTFFCQHLISGKVIDANSNEPLPGANVYLQDTDIGVTTNDIGEFLLNINQNNNSDNSLIVSYLGYHNQIIDLKNLNENKLIIPLKKSFLNLDQIVVTGTKTERFLKDTPVTTRVISKEQLQNSGVGDISQALSEISGIVIYENYFNTGRNTVEIQGFSSQHIHVLVDGIKMIGRVDGQLDISEIPLSQVERIEIVKGAASALYGSEAMGGVINIITKENNNNFSVASDLVTGSYGRFDGNIAISAPISIWKPAFNFSYRKYDGYDLDKETASEDGTTYDKYHGQFNIVGNFSEDLKLNINTFYFEEEHVVKGSQIFEDHYLNDHFAGRTELSKKNFFKNFNIKAGLEFSQYEHKYDKLVLSSGFYKKGDITNEKLLRGDVLFDTKLGLNLINGGYSIEYEKITSDRVLGSEQNSTLHNFFLQDEIEASKWLVALGGLRIDAHLVYGSQLSPKVSLMVKSSNTSRIRFSYAEGFRAPTFKELFIEYKNSDVKKHILGNPDLEPEKSISYQGDFEYWNNSNFHLRFHIFYNNINNLIDYEDLGYDGDGFYMHRTQNLDKVNTWGGNFEAEIFPYDFLNCKIGYSFFDSKDFESDKALSFRSKHKADFSLSVNLIEFLSINFRGQFFGKQYYWSEDGLHQIVKHDIDGYLLLHTNINYKIYDNMSLYSGLRNLTDYFNKTWGPMPGREWYAGIKYNWQ